MKRYLWAALAVLLAAGLSVSTVAAYSKYQERNRISEQYGYMESELASLNRKIEMAEMERPDPAATGDSQLKNIQRQMEELNRELEQEEELLAAAQSTLEELTAEITQADLDNIRKAQEEELAREREARRQAEEEEARRSSQAAASQAAASAASQAQPSSSRTSSQASASSNRQSSSSRAQSSGSASGSGSESSSSKITVKKTSSSSASAASTAPGEE